MKMIMRRARVPITSYSSISLSGDVLSGVGPNSRIKSIGWDYSTPSLCWSRFQFNAREFRTWIWHEDGVEKV